MQGPLVPNTPESAQYAQLFFYNPAYAANLRHQRNQNLDLGILRDLTDMLHDVNPFISIYKTAREQLQELEYANNTDVRVLFTPQLKLILESQADKRRYNLPDTEEVAVIIPDETSEHTFRDIRMAN